VKSTQTLTALKAGVASFAIGVSMAAAPAYAQTAEDEADDSQVIVVTGSLIRNPNLEQSNPVNVTTSDQIELKQSNTAEEVLREIPGVVANIGSAVNNGNGGSSFVDLRGLGANRNIVLLDGNRLPSAGVSGVNSSSAVDLNNIPLALVSRVDALTGAAVTTYGADAITGVVNFITKKDFAGVELAASEQLTQQGDGNFARVDLTVGANFGDGRGNAVLSIGYQDSDPVFQGDRDFSLTQISSYTGGPAGSGTTIPARFTGTRPIDAATGLPSLNPAVANRTGAGQINSAGQAVATFATFNFNPYNAFQVPFQRYNMFAQANYEVSDAIEVYTRAMFSKNTVNTIIAPSGSFASAVTINLNNPFLPVALRNQFCAFNVGTSTVYTPRFTPAQCAAAATATGATDPNYRTVTTNLGRRAVENGPRISDYRTTIFDYRIGARGAITDTVDWDITGAYGESENVQTIKNYTLQSRFRQGLLVNGTVANAVCQDTSKGCVPVDVFSVNGYSAAAADFLNENSTTTNRTSLAQVRGIISGDLGLTLPGASEAVGFAVGGEYRSYKAQQASDTLAKTPGELGGAGGAAPDINGGYTVYEGYAELIAPIFDILTLEAGARYSHYSVERGGTNNTFTYKFGGTLEPYEGLKLRGNYAKAVRAPNIYELFNPPNTQLTNLGIDPCAGAAPTTNANLRAICIAQGAPAGSIGQIANPTAGQANITIGGNRGLNPEKARTFTGGVVFQPSFAPRFSVSVDYYNIKVTDVIGAPLPGDLIGACFNGITAASASKADCTIIRRDPVAGGLDGDPSTTFGLFAPLNNLGTLRTDGVDLIANYNMDLGFGKLDLNFVGNWTRHAKYQATPSSLNRECAGYYSVNCSYTGSIQPKLQFSQRSTLSVGAVDISLLWRWIDTVSFEPAQIEDDGGDAASVLAKFRKIPAEHYFDLTFRFNAGEHLTFAATAQNLLDNQPKVVGNTIGATTFNSGNVYPSTYDALGRRFAVSAKLKF
jgi:iron complex outermembrane recepter protein